MSHRLTRRFVQAQVARLTAAMRTARLIGDHESIALEWGSKINGVSFRLWKSDASGPRNEQPFGTLHFGFTVGEASKMIDALIAGLEAANAAWTRRTEPA